MSKFNRTDQEFYDLTNRARENFYNYKILTEKTEIDGITAYVKFHCVGQNASHYFWLGMRVSDGLIICRSECGTSGKINYCEYQTGDYIGHW